MTSKKQFRAAALAVILLVAMIFSAAWLNRQTLRDLAYRWQQPALPAAIGIEEAQKLSATEAVKQTTTVATAISKPVPEENMASAGNDSPANTVATPPATPSAATQTPPAANQIAPTLPKEINIKVPMVYQAPFSVWDALHEDACEEAAFLMLKWFRDGRTSVTRDEMETGIQQLVAYENGIDYGLSIDADQAVTVMKNDLGLTTARILPVSNIEDVKRELAAGRPVILPAAGKELHNPNFRNGGPLYHMLVAKGYTANGKIITNDPGTRLGKDYLYADNVLFDAIHDWNGGDVANGRKVMIVVD
ncbi:MAG: C39 family peptidase [Patescibacteria group bacterium]|nr:C39 family peptidase [Patescibacteria group bacterium]